jgi:hypothetical protein
MFREFTKPGSSLVERQLDRLLYPSGSRALRGKARSSAIHPSRGSALQASLRTQLPMCDMESRPDRTVRLVFSTMPLKMVGHNTHLTGFGHSHYDPSG